jgi:hypothetical protein
VPYYVAEPGKGRRQWNIPIDQLITIGQMLGKNLSKPGVVSPAQADRLGLDEAVSNNYSSIIPGAVKLVPQNNTAARRVFGKG